ncbi:MAG: hypothetical protein JO040_04290 [Gemmatimonadetes bacterium]|nr:hypothetical protein [Gemmatimonadota bacterium]
MTSRFAVPAAVLLALAALAGCGPGAPTISTRPTPTSVPPMDTPPIPESEAVRPRVGPGVEGTYTLVEVNGSTLPATVELRPGCSARVVTARLALERGRFSFSGTTQESCNGRNTGPMARRAEGSYRRDDDAVHFTAQIGGRSGTAEGQILDDRTLSVVSVTALGQTRELALRFRRDVPDRVGTAER